MRSLLIAYVRQHLFTTTPSRLGSVERQLLISDQKKRFVGELRVLRNVFVRGTRPPGIGTSPQLAFHHSFTFEVVCAEETRPRPLKEASHVISGGLRVAKTRSAVSAAGKTLHHFATRQVPIPRGEKVESSKLKVKLGSTEVCFAIFSYKQWLFVFEWDCGVMLRQRSTNLS